MRGVGDKICTICGATPGQSCYNFVDDWDPETHYIHFGDNMPKVHEIAKGMGYIKDGKPTPEQIMGIFGEEAFSQMRGGPSYWDMRGDVGPYEVRTTTLDKSLYVWDDEVTGQISKRKPFVLIYHCDRGTEVHNHAVGWIYGSEGRDRSWKTEVYSRGYCNFIDKSELHPMEELPRERDLSSDLWAD